MPVVKTIPATKPRSSAASAPTDNQAKRRVAAYARVSTDHTEQAMSYEAQVDYYSRYIRSRDDWTFAGMYAHEMAAISEQMEEAVCQTASGSVNQIEYGRRYKELADRYDETKADHDAAVEAIRTKLSGAAATRRFIAVLNGLDGPVTEFDPDLWGNLLD